MHKAVCCQAVKILKFYADTYPSIELRQMIEEKDYQGLSALEYAKLTERPEILEMLEKMRSGLTVEVPVKKIDEDYEQPIQIN